MANIILTKEEMLNLDLEVLPLRLTDCERHFNNVSKETEALLDQFELGFPAEIASIKDIKRCIYKVQE